MSKQDRQGARTPSDLEQKYNFNKTFAEIMGVATDARNLAWEAKNAYAGLNQEEIFKLLTNNGAWEGIYESNGQAYINASYIKSGLLLADLIKAGVLKSVDGQTFSLDLEKGEMALKPGGREIMTVNKEGAKLCGWSLSPDYLGTANAGLNGNIAWQNSNLGEVIRFYAGANTKITRLVAYIEGRVNYSGVFEGSLITPFLMNEFLLPETTRIEAYNPYRELTEADFDEENPLTYTRITGNLISATGKLKDASLMGNEMMIVVHVNACVPAFQVLDSGALIAPYAEIGGYSIANLADRIKALEGKVGGS